MHRRFDGSFAHGELPGHLAIRRRPIGRVIAFVGARGGVGSSTLCHNIGWVIAEEQHINTTIVDFDLPFGTVALNDEPGQSIADALATPERLDDVLLDRILLKRGDYLSLFAAPASIERDYEHGHDAYEAVIDAVRQSSPCVAIDLPHIWTPWVKGTLIAADEIVLVASPDLASLRNTKNLIDLLKVNLNNGEAESVENGNGETTMWLMDGHGHVVVRVDQRHLVSPPGQLVGGRQPRGARADPAALAGLTRARTVPMAVQDPARSTTADATATRRARPPRPR